MQCSARLAARPPVRRRLPSPVTPTHYNYVGGVMVGLSIYIALPTYICIYSCIYMAIHTHIRVCICTCKCIYIYIYIYMYIYAYVYTCAHAPIYIRIKIQMCLYIYTYIIYIYIDIHMYMFCIYIPRDILRTNSLIDWPSSSPRSNPTQPHSTQLVSRSRLERACPLLVCL